MIEYKVEFYVDNRRSETIIRAYSSADARKLVEAQYLGSNVRIISVTRI